LDVDSVVYCIQNLQFGPGQLEIQNPRWLLPGTVSCRAVVEGFFKLDTVFTCSNIFASWISEPDDDLKTQEETEVADLRETAVDSPAHQPHHVTSEGELKQHVGLVRNQENPDGGICQTTTFDLRTASKDSFTAGQDT
jgi:hypothetical protein